MIINMPQGTPNGSYKLVANGYDENHVLLGTDSTVIFNYEKVTPVVPDTGGGFLSELNIARSDVLITGLLVFLAATIAAFILVYRKKEQ